jgi:hypothetical protein
MVKVTKENRIYLVLFVFAILFLIKLSALPADIENIKENGHESDLNHYLKISKWFAGIQDHETPRTYQYPPLYPILLIPALFKDTVIYVLFLNALLSALTFFPLYLLSKKYTGFYQAILISSLVIILNMLFSIKSYGYPMILSSFLFVWFTYFLSASVKERKAFYLASLSFALLLFTKYVYFYLLPLIIIWFLYLKRDDLKAGIKSILQFGILPAVFFLLWSLRNILLHGASIEGAIGGYESLTNQQAFMGIFIDTIPSKLASIITCLEPNAVMMYFILFFFGLLIMKNNKKTWQYDHWFLIGVFIIFFCFPAMTYNRFYLNWRYLIPLTPVYLIHSFVNFFSILKMSNLFTFNF